jgi:hypothetical protein
VGCGGHHRAPRRCFLAIVPAPEVPTRLLHRGSQPRTARVAAWIPFERGLPGARGLWAPLFRKNAYVLELLIVMIRIKGVLSRRRIDTLKLRIGSTGDTPLPQRSRKDRAAALHGRICTIYSALRCTSCDSCRSFLRRCVYPIQCITIRNTTKNRFSDQKTPQQPKRTNVQITNFLSAVVWVGKEARAAH